MTEAQKMLITLAAALDLYTDQELIRLKWASEGLAQAIKDERQARDALAPVVIRKARGE